jgi:hydroxypyruvate reductase
MLRVSAGFHAPETSSDTLLEFDLDKAARVFVLGAGKATAPMARAVEELLGERIHEGVIAVKYGHTDRLSRIEVIEAGHPVPDENSERAAARLLETADRAGPDDLVITLVSGGGSALLAAPLDTGGSALSLREIQLTTDALLRSGAAIDEMNCVRKHLSAIKGGRLAARISPARQVTLILSDVVGDRLDSIASGLTAPDPTTYAQALAILERYGITGSVPRTVIQVFRAGIRGRIPDTPKPGDKLFGRVDTIVLGSNITALRAAEQQARDLGFETITLSSRITGEASQIARFYAGIAKDQRARRLLTSAPVCVLGGGETTVTVRGTGKGGRNQELALAFLIEFLNDLPQGPLAAGSQHGPPDHGEHDGLPSPGEHHGPHSPDPPDPEEHHGPAASGPQAETLAGIGFLSAATDGGDGPTDAAGAFVTRISGSSGLEVALESFRNNDSYTFFSENGGLLKTGPTNTNVCDLHLLIVL